MTTGASSGSGASTTTGMLQLHSLPTVRCLIEWPFTFFDSSSHTGTHSASDCLIFPPAHEKSKLEILFIEFIVRIVCFGRSYNLGAGILECPLNNSLINGITSGQTFDLLFVCNNMNKFVNIVTIIDIPTLTFQEYILGAYPYSLSVQRFLFPEPPAYPLVSRRICIELLLEFRQCTSQER